MHYYKILKHKAGFDEGTNYWEKLLARYLAATGGGKIHATLPITFTSTSWKLVSWTIYGNNTPNNYSAEGTLPLTFTTHMAGAASDWSISGNDENGTENLFDGTMEQGGLNSGTEYNSSTRVRSTFMSNMLDAGTYTINASGVNAVVVNYFDDNKTYTEGITTWRTLPLTFNISSRCYVRFSFKMSDQRYVTPSDISNIMLVKGSSAPDHYIPYQQGVGERTANLLPFTNGTKTSNNVSAICVNGSYIVSIGEGETVFTELSFDIPPVTFPISVVAGGMGVLSLFNTAKTGVSICFKNSGTIVQRFELNSENRIFDDYTNLGGATINRISFRIQANTAAGSLTIKPILTDDRTTPPSFIPYGYEIPLTVSQQGQPDKTVDIYIGDSPLTAGQSVSKASTGVDIAAIAGSNTITTELYNKPEMAITGVDYVGVGEKTTIPFNQWENGTTITGPAQVGHPYSDCKTASSLTTRRRSVDIVPVIDGTAVLNVTSGYQIADIHFDKDGLYIGNSAAYHNSGYTTILPSTVKYVALVVKKSNGSAFVDGDTWGASITYIGDKAYKIPLTISQTGQTDKNYDIYIGDSPLTEGQSISNTTEIEVFEGENTIDTTLYNKPEMEIVYE